MSCNCQIWNNFVSASPSISRSLVLWVMQLWFVLNCMSWTFMTLDSSTNIRWNFYPLMKYYPFLDMNPYRFHVQFCIHVYIFSLYVPFRRGWMFLQYSFLVLCYDWGDLDFFKLIKLSIFIKLFYLLLGCHFVYFAGASLRERQLLLGGSVWSQNFTWLWCTDVKWHSNYGT